MSSDLVSLTEHLQQRFDTHADSTRWIVFWHDLDGDYADELDELALEGVQLVQAQGDDYAIKYRLLQQEPTANFLVYRSGTIPAGVDNWLLDLELAYEVFTADRAAMLQQDLGLTGDGIDDVLREHEAFFNAARRTDRLKELVGPDDDPDRLRAKMCAVLLGLRQEGDWRLAEITRELLIENAVGDDARYSELAKYGLDAFYWSGTARIYGYLTDTPSMDDFVLWLFHRAAEGFAADGAGASRHIDIDFQSFRNDRRSTNALKKLAHRSAGDLDYRAQIMDLGFRDLLNADVFAEADLAITAQLVESVTQRTVSLQEVREAVRKRRDRFWADDFRHLYDAIAYGAELLEEISNLDLAIASFDAGLTRYRDEWWRLDQLYRKFCRAARGAENPSRLEMLRELVEKAYTNQYVYELGLAWQTQVDAVPRWLSQALDSQTTFYRKHVAPIIKDGRKKVAVIISDALRYEIADELGAQIRSENRFDAELDAMLGVLPSYTQLGMAALLPHEAIGHSPKGDPVLVDGQRSDGTVNRAKILSAVGGLAIQAEKVRDMPVIELREIYREHQVLYIYHDRIDAAGDDAKTEPQVFEAAEDAIGDLVMLVKKLANANANNLLITADHGFLFQNTPLSEQQYLSEKVHGDQVVATSRRYVLGRGLKDDPAFRLFEPESLGLVSDLQVQIPKSIQRLRLSGSGSRFVHGGASLQEIVIPVLTINKKRADDIRMATVKIHPDTDKITTGQLSVLLYQADPVSDKVHARGLRAGLYVGERLISNEVDLTFSEASADKRDRYQTVQLLLTKEADQFNGRPAELCLAQRVRNTSQWKRYASATYTIQRSFTTDFDF